MKVVISMVQPMPIWRVTDSWRSEPSADCTGCAPHEHPLVLRCECGSLLARYVGGRIELKCPRCKRTVSLPIEHPAEDGCDRD